MACIACGVLSLLAVSLAVGLLWPRDPQWHLEKLHIAPNALDGLIQVATGKANSSSPLLFLADVSLFNPNFIGAKASAGTFTIFSGDEVLATGVSQPLTAGARAWMNVPTNVTVLVAPSLARQLAEDMPRQNFQLPLFVTAKATSWALGLVLHCKVQCEVQADVLQLLTQPEKVVAQHSCKYSYVL